VTLATFSLGDPSIAQLDLRDSGKKAPPKRTSAAIADRTLAPERR